MAQLWSVTCHMGSHSVCYLLYPTQVNTPHLNPSHAGWYSIYLPRRDGRLSWPSWLDSTRPGVEPATFRSRVQCSTNATTKTTGVSNKHRHTKLLWRFYFF